MDENALKEIVSKRIAEARMRKGLNQSEMARALGVHASAISYWETGSRLPQLNYLDAICKTLSVSADYIIGLTSDFAKPGESTIAAVSTEEEPDFFSKEQLAFIQNSCANMLVSVSASMKEKTDAMRAEYDTAMTQIRTVIEAMQADMQAQFEKRARSYENEIQKIVEEKLLDSGTAQSVAESIQADASSRIHDAIDNAIRQWSEVELPKIVQEQTSHAVMGVFAKAAGA